jgi:hypothetical protein
MLQKATEEISEQNEGEMMSRYFGGKYEETIRFVDKNGIKQDIITAFDTMPAKEEINKRRLEIIEKHNKVDIAIVELITKPSLSPYELSLKMNSVNITAKTTWDELLTEKSIDNLEVK